MKTMLIACLLLLSSCATVFNSTRQKVSITSEPSGAKVYVKGEAIGITPMEYDLKRKTKVIELKKDDFTTYSKTLKRGINGWYYVDLGLCITGFGIIPMFVDLIDGACYKFKEPQMFIELEKVSKPANEEIKQ